MLNRYFKVKKQPYSWEEYYHRNLWGTVQLGGWKLISAWTRLRWKQLLDDELDFDWKFEARLWKQAGSKPNQRPGLSHVRFSEFRNHEYPQGPFTAFDKFVTMKIDPAHEPIMMMKAPRDLCIHHDNAQQFIRLYPCQCLACDPKIEIDLRVREDDTNGFWYKVISRPAA